MNSNLISINVTLDIYSSVICFLIIISIIVRKAIKDKPSLWFALTCFSTTGLSVSDIFTWIGEGTDALWKIRFLPVFHFLFYCFGALIFVCYLRYIIELLSVKTKINKWYWRICLIIFVIYFTGIVITPFTGFYYIITPENRYVRGICFWFTTLVDIIFYIESMILIFSKRKYMKLHQLISVISFIFIPAIMQAIQIFNYGIALNCTGLAFSFLIVFINLQQRLEESLAASDRAIKQRDDTIIQMQDNTIISLSNLVENRDADTGHHVKRTREFVKIIAEQCLRTGLFTDQITEAFINLLIKSAPMHDIGKIIVPDEILKKPGKLTEEEFDFMKKHAAEGGRIINEVLGIGVDPDYLRIATEISTGHHEKWDGSGYPNQLKAEEIPLSARIMAIADVFDALVSKRCYKESLPIEEAFEIIKSESGSHFDPFLVKQFLKCKDKITTVVNEFYD